MKVRQKIPGLELAYLNNPNATLQGFFDWYAHHGNTMSQAPVEGITFIGNGPGLVLHREKPFQVQLFICYPNTVIPEHSHPYIESYEVQVSGDVNFIVDGVEIAPEAYINEPRKDGLDIAKIWGYRAYIGAGVKHKAIIGPRGGAFLSVQRWLKGDPTSVDDDWEGSPMTADHMEHLSHVLAKRLNDPEFVPYISGQLCD